MKSKIFFKKNLIDFLKWSEKYMETDMVYVFKGSFWLTLGKAGVFLISFLKMIAFSKYASQEVYGTYVFIVSMAMIFQISSLPGIKISLIKAIAQEKEGTLILAIKEKLKFSLIGSFISLIASGWYFYNGNNLLAISFFAVAFLMPFQSVFTIFHAFWLGRKDFKKESKYSLISAFLVALVVIPVIIFTNNPALIIIALLTSQSLFNGIILRKTLKEKKNNEVMSEAISFGKNLTIMSAITSFVGQIDKVILWKFLGPIHLAIYSFAQTPIIKLLEAIPINYLVLPKMGEKNIKEIKLGILKKFKKLFFIFIPLTILMILTVPSLYKLIFPQYIESIPYFQALSFLIIFLPFSILGSALISEMKKKELYIIQIITPISKIILFLTLVPLFQVWGVIIAILISEIFKGIITFYYFKKI